MLKTTLASICFVFAAPAALAVPYGFENITGNGSVDVASQLQVDVSQLASNKVGVRLTNTGSIASIITALYVDDSLGLFSSGSLNDKSAGVSFKGEGSGSGNLPGGNPIGFSSDFWFNRSSGPGGVANGIDASLSGSEFALFSFILNGATYGSALQAIEDGNLRFGLHVQSIGTASFSDSFVVYSPPEESANVPENGSTIALVAVSFGLLVALRRTFGQRRPAEKAL